MCVMCYFWLTACSILMVNANILNDLQEAQKVVEQLDYDYSAVADAVAQQRQGADLLWYDYGGGVGGNSVSGGGGGGGSGYYGPESKATGEKRGGTTQSGVPAMWFGPRLGRRKRHGGPTFNGGMVQPMDGNAIGQDAAADATAAAAVELQAAIVAGLLDNAPWVVEVPIVENSIWPTKQNTRNGRSSSEDSDEPFSVSRHAARSPPYSPPYSPRLGRQVSMARPTVPRLGREASVYRRAVAAAAASLLPRQQHQQQQQLQQQQQQATPAATESAAATASAAARRRSV